MNQAPDPDNSATAGAERELARVQAKIDAARAVLVRLLQDVVATESRMSTSQAAQLLEANEELVVGALRSQAEAETAAQALDEVARKAELDPLTQLPNRVLLLDRLGHAIAGASRHGDRLALMFLDLDDFKQVNDTLGHGFGDEVLKLVAQRLAGAVRAADTISRHGGDEFLILLAEVTQPSDAALIAAKVIAALGLPCSIGGHDVSLSASIGISTYPDDGANARTLIERADAAMYRAKRHGHGTIAFHGQPLAGEPGPDAPPAARGMQLTLAQHERALAEHERRNAELREANEQLVLAALSAQELRCAAEQAQQRQAEFIAVVADELRNPLAPIRIASEMLGRQPAHDPLLPRVQAMVEQHVAQLSRLVDEARDGARDEGRALALERSRVNLAGVIDQAVALCRPAIAARRQWFDLQLPGPALEVHGDPARLVQVVGNLLDNASRHSHDGGAIGLAVELAGDAIVMTLSDSGIGITAQALPQVFDPFVQDELALGVDGVGLGIGLTVVRALVQAHGGTVEARSAGSGQGSQFVVTLPRAQGPASAADGPVAAAGPD